jgi:hypothetical protein
MRQFDGTPGVVGFKTELPAVIKADGAGVSCKNWINKKYEE